MAQTNCTGWVLDQDGERVCECGDEGRMCEPCETEMANRWLAEWLSAPLAERDPQEYADQMIDAGRGHLLTEDERQLARTAKTWDYIIPALLGLQPLKPRDWSDEKDPGPLARDPFDEAADDAGVPRFGPI